jgi:tetratricopeptide (TPR) repeat protein
MAGPRWLGVVVVVAALVRSSGPASAAEPEGEAAEARSAFEQAKRAYNLSRWQEAADGFEKAYRLSGDPVLLYNRAQALRRAGRLEDALATYRAYLRERPGAPNRVAVEAKIEALERSVRARETSVQPAPVEADIAEPAAPAATPPAAAQTGRGLPWAGVGLTAALAGGAVVMGLSVNRRFEHLRDTCGRTVGCSEEQKSDLRTRITVTNVLWALAGVSAVATGVSFFVGRGGAEVAVARRF